MSTPDAFDLLMAIHDLGPRRRRNDLERSISDDARHILYRASNRQTGWMMVVKHYRDHAQLGRLQTLIDLVTPTQETP
jgi:hypothetical protein